MKRILLCLALLPIGLGPICLGVAEAGPRRPPDQDRARMAMRQGAMPLRDIQQQWRQDMPGYDYLGSDYDPGSGSYRLKFMRGGSVSWVDVDERTGREIGRSPH